MVFHPPALRFSSDGSHEEGPEMEPRVAAAEPLRHNSSPVNQYFYHLNVDIDHDEELRNVCRSFRKYDPLRRYETKEELKERVDVFRDKLTYEVFKACMEIVGVHARSTWATESFFNQLFEVNEEDLDVTHRDLKNMLKPYIDKKVDSLMSIHLASKLPGYWKRDLGVSSTPIRNFDLELDRMTRLLQDSIARGRGHVKDQVMRLIPVDEGGMREEAA